MEAFSLEDFPEEAPQNKEEEEKKRLENKQKCLDLLKKVRDEEPIKPTNAISRNIVFVGKTRSGKSTSFQVLQKAQHIPKRLSIFSDTVDPKITNFTVTKIFKSKEEFDEFDKKANVSFVPVEEVDSHGNKIIKVNFNIGIIDTPGLFEVKRMGQEVRDNAMLKKTILRCMEYEITSVNAIFFVCSFSSGINQEDVKAFEQFLSLFEGADNNVALLITRSEDLDDNKCRDLVRQLTQEPKMKGLLEKIKMKIYFTGALPDEDVTNVLIEAIDSKLKLVEKRRLRLLESIFLQSSECNLNNLSFVKEYEKEVCKYMKDFLDKKKMSLSHKTLSEDLRKELIELREKIEENKSFITSNESRKMQKEIVNIELAEKIPKCMELLEKMEEKWKRLREAEEKKEEPETVSRLTEEYTSATSAFEKLRAEIELGMVSVDEGSENKTRYVGLVKREFEFHEKRLPSLKSTPSDLPVVFSHFRKFRPFLSVEDKNKAHHLFLEYEKLFPKVTTDSF